MGIALSELVPGSWGGNMKMRSTYVEGDQANLHENVGVFDWKVLVSHTGGIDQGGEILLLASLTGWARDIL